MKKSIILSLLFLVTLMATGQNYSAKSDTTQSANRFTQTEKTAYYINNTLFDYSTLKLINPNEIERVDVIHGTFTINHKTYNGKVYITLKENAPFKLLYLKNKKNLPTTIDTVDTASILTQTEKPAYYVNHVLCDLSRIRSLNPKDIARVTVIKGTFKINNKTYSGKVYVELKKNSFQ